MSNQNLNLGIFGFIIMSIGVALIYFSVNTQNQLNPTCNNSKLFTYLNLILMLAVLLTILPIVTFICHNSDMCVCPDKSGFSDTSSYMIVFSILCILIIILAGLANTELTNSETLCKTDGARTNITVMIVMPLIPLVLIIGYYMFPKMLDLFSGKDKNN
jgi:uncharacterized membrane protein YidH (DUF202 family)